MSATPVFQLPELPPWELHTCWLWPKWPAMDFSKGDRNRILSHRAGGHYSLDGEAKALLRDDLNGMYSRRAALTSWLMNQRKQGEFAPLITLEVINAVDAEQDFAVEDAKRRVLAHFASGGPGWPHRLRDDRALSMTNLDVVHDRPWMINELYEDARILAHSGCDDWNELGVVMDNLKNTGLVKAIPIADCPEWRNYSLTFEGLNEANTISSEREHPGPRSRGAADILTDAAAKNVFVIHGRNDEARVAVSDFLGSVGLNPIQWEAAVRETGHASPYVGQILDAAFAQARAAVVILTPDDIVTLRPDLRRPDDHPGEREYVGQPRPNVLFEAGMAMSLFEDRTIIVEIGKVKSFSDILGRHAVRLADSAIVEKSWRVGWKLQAVR